MRASSRRRAARRAGLPVGPGGGGGRLRGQRRIRGGRARSPPRGVRDARRARGERVPRRRVQPHGVHPRRARGRRTRRRGASAPRPALAERALSLVDLRDRRGTAVRVVVISCHAVGARTRASRSRSRAASARASATASACRAALRRGGAARGWRISAGGTGASAKPRGQVRLVRRTSWPAAPWTPSTARGTCLPVGIVMIGATPWVCNYNVPVGATPRERAPPRARRRRRRPAANEDTREDTTSRRARRSPDSQAPERARPGFQRAGHGVASRRGRARVVVEMPATSSTRRGPGRRRCSGDRAFVCGEQATPRSAGMSATVRHQPHAGDHPRTLPSRRRMNGASRRA